MGDLPRHYQRNGNIKYFFGLIQWSTTPCWEKHVKPQFLEQSFYGSSL
ncbi:hypothetical protein HMPREF1218_2189 [Hoylesella pleuritidis F0068]|uniref:Uncharacterized protein n=1 Tax=Hoylesella pleuritidis F0068 TaxID=1081904 RepID=U2LGD8_9BACT|nr:hypothetical protein HMPREF1218_2189 [Hoylesella pleuritidis F0068]